MPPRPIPFDLRHLLRGSHGDHAPLVAGRPETREYQVQAYQNNQTVSPNSPIVAVVTLT